MAKAITIFIHAFELNVNEPGNKAGSLYITIKPKSCSHPSTISFEIERDERDARISVISSLGFWLRFQCVLVSTIYYTFVFRFFLLLLLFRRHFSSTLHGRSNVNIDVFSERVRDRVRGRRRGDRWRQSIRNAKRIVRKSPFCRRTNAT